MNRISTSLLAILALVLASCGGNTAVNGPTAVIGGEKVITQASPPADTPAPAPTDTTLPEPTNTLELPTATPNAKVFEIPDPTSYKDSINNLWFVGIINYTGDKPRVRPDVVITLTDGTGKVLGTGKASTVPSLVKPNSNIPYKILIDNPPEKWEKSEIVIQADEMSDFDKALTYGDLEVSDTSLIPPKNQYDQLKLVGKVKNVGQQGASLIQLIAVAYDAGGKVLDVNNTFASLDKLAPGQDSPFELMFLNTKAADKTEITVSGMPSN